VGEKEGEGERNGEGLFFFDLDLVLDLRFVAFLLFYLWEIFSYFCLTYVSWIRFALLEGGREKVRTRRQRWSRALRKGQAAAQSSQERENTRFEIVLWTSYA